MIRILTDSASDILPAEAAQLGVDVIPLNVTLEDGTVIRDGVDLTPSEYYEHMAGCKKLPTTSQPSPELFEKFYAEAAAAGDEALKWMPEREDKAADDHVFSLPSNINQYLKPWAEAAGITKRFTFHTARHTFATMMLTLGADLYTVSKLLGHTSVRMTQVYAKIINQKKDEAVNLVNGLFD